jgi:mannose-1-phosphate guanylyltransferase
VIGAGARIGDGASIESSVIGAGAVVGPRTNIVGSIVGEQARIGAGCEVSGLCVIGPGAEVGDGNMLDHGMRIAADQRISSGAISFS